MAARILVVEDDQVMARLVTRALERAGYETIHAENATIAADALSDFDFDLIVMDLFLPDGDGLALCRQIRTAHDLPVVMISSLEEDIGKSVVHTELGPQAFLSKPFKFDVFLRQIAELIEH